MVHINTQTCNWMQYSMVNVWEYNIQITTLHDAEQIDISSLRSLTLISHFKKSKYIVDIFKLSMKYPYLPTATAWQVGLPLIHSFSHTICRFATHFRRNATHLNDICNTLSLLPENFESRSHILKNFGWQVLFYPTEIVGFSSLWNTYLAELMQEKRI